MKIDILIEYNPKLSEITFSSSVAKFTKTGAARLGLSRPKHENLDAEQIEFVGESWEVIRKIEDYFPKEPTRKDKILRIINPFESSEFEPERTFRMIQHFVRYIRLIIFPKTCMIREIIPFLDRNEITLKIPGYNLFDPQKKVEFEKLMLTKYKYTSFIS